MVRKVGIVGAGHVGADVAFSLVTQGLCDVIVLLDENQPKAASQALELRDMASLVSSRVKVLANDYAELHDADVLVVAVGPKTLLREDRLEELAETRAAVRQVIPQVIASGFGGVILNITNPCDVITQIIQQTSGFPHSQVLGTGTSLDTARMKRVVGEFFGFDPKSVTGYVLGEHGESQFVAWSTVRLGGRPVAELAGDRDVDWAQMDDRVRGGGWDILQGKGWTSFGIATATARLVDVILSDANSVYPVSAWDENLKVYIGQPAVIGKRGVVQTLMPELTAYENIAYHASSRVILAAINSEK
ncbi:MAG: L-lactate dehydrogenase [Ewingella americana]|jgi:L-lactate dehydrogenase|uniref:L-lactate dehydrogenase n=1 Tax=Ewingella americana TaxID=41202 RepID=UPI00242F9B23|nr:L-lactate dehydrogenase [Ewingella americana]MCI1677428.1 L-lactate dehydrogenase [Ewingella americana]MCI1852883.1 L-lactate dehydrogenase [Ewingella americana]MCI1861031.1 L-lactate dehydrogenase [Ewingella americana]MCI2143993.1 L-lactate dehydrogenase [Ewingella americana]MCI2165767.1 L-lactate dehydrogenase [Ewingella americana]